MKKITNIFLVIIFVGIFYISGTNISQAAGPTIVPLDLDVSVWTKEGSPYVVSSQVNVKMKLTIEPGVVVKFGKNGWMNITSELVAKGTADEKIIFTSLKDDSSGGDTNGDGDDTIPQKGDWSYLLVSGRSDANFEDVVVSYSNIGIYASQYGYSSYNTGNITVKNSEIKYNNKGIYIYEEKPIIENNIISNNGIGVYIYSDLKYGIAQIVNNSIVNNDKGAEAFKYSSGHDYYLDATNNWWGDKNGPYFKHVIYGQDNLDTTGNSVNDGIIFDLWLGCDPSKIRKPVILIPGIGASINPDLMISGILSDDWVMFDHTYDGIIQSFKDMGYTEGVDFFIAYYDWRNSNADSAKDYLKPLIQKANLLNGTSEVNIVAHSMGGLVARSYIESDDYNNDVDNLIMLATPNKGSSDIYDVWEGGYIPKNWNSKSIMRAYLRYMNVGNKTFNSYQTVHKYIPSIGELMPRYDYIYPKNNLDGLKNHTAMEEDNTFLDGLNSKIDLLNQRVSVSIIAGQEQSTVNTIPVIDSDDNNENLWKDGKPDPIDPQKNDSNGDGEVMLSSAQIQSKFFDTLSYGHREIVSQSENIIAQRLSETLDNIVNSPQINDEMIFWFASPVDVEITDPNGKKITSDNINQIPLAKYAGESNPDGFKIFSIPNPKVGEYGIEITGNGNGEYHIGSEYADYTGTKNDKSSIVQGEIALGESKQYEITYNPQDENPTEDIKIVDTTPPVITATVLPEANESGWNNSDVTVHFDATDDSGIKSVTPDVILNEEKENQLATGTAEDNAGNVSNKTISGISIDKTAPNTVANLTGTKGNSNWYTSPVTIHFSAVDNLSGVEKTFYALDGSDEQSGDALTISTDGMHQIKYHSIDKAGNRETEKTLEIKIDQGAPSIKISSPQNTIYKNSAMLAIKYAVSDEQSSMDKISVKVFYDGKEINQNKLDFSLEKLGAHSVAVIAMDEAGNQSDTVEINFSIKTDIKSISQNIQHYFSLGLIKTRTTEMILELQLRNIEELTRLLDTFQSRWMPRWAKDRVVQSLKQNINRQIDALERQLRQDRNFGRAIDPKIQTILLEDLESVKVQN